MSRDYKEDPKVIFSLRKRMKKMIECLNEAKIFNEKIPYLVIHQEEKMYSSKLELNLSYRDNIKEIITDKNVDKSNKQFEEYIIEKLNKIPNIDFKQINEVYLEMLDKTNEEQYLVYTVAHNFKVYNNEHEDANKISNNCILRVTLYNKETPLFEIYGL